MNEDVITLVFVFFVVVFLFFDRKNIKREGILFIRRSARFKDLIEKVGKKIKGKPYFFLSLLSIIIGFGLMGFSIFYLLKITFLNLFRPTGYQPTPTVGIVVPHFSPICKPPYVICFPTLYWIIAIFVIIAFHESMHGIFAASSNVKIKSVGYAFLAILPAAFVEPEERELKKLKPIEKIKIYSAGSFGNIIAVLILLLLLQLISNVFASIFYPIGLEYEVINNTPAYFSKLNGTLIGINNFSIRTIEDLQNVLSKYKPNETIIVKTTKGEFKITLTKHPQNITRGFIGIKNIRVKLKAIHPFFENFKQLFFVLFELFKIIIVLNIAVACVNMLPIKPLDGGLIIHEILEILEIEKKEEISLLISFTFFFLLLLSVISTLIP